jgi:hypothetical protein
MPISLATLLATLWSIFRSRAALELENLALRHQISVLQRSAARRPKINLGGPPAVDLSVQPLTRLALGAGHRQARSGRGRGRKPLELWGSFGGMTSTVGCSEFSGGTDPFSLSPD